MKKKIESGGIPITDKRTTKYILHLAKQMGEIMTNDGRKINLSDYSTKHRTTI